MQFGAIEADTPNLFQTYSAKGEGRSPKYDLMAWSEIEALPVAAIAARHCALFLWTSRPFLGHSLAVGRAWGFRYYSWVFTWVKLTTVEEKPAFGLGCSSRSQTEKVLLFLRGSPRRRSSDVPELIFAPTGGHSEKPEEVKRRIERLYRGPYLELFGTREYTGWTVIGNAITRRDIREDLDLLAARE